jgi:hypothetical protein
MLTTVLVMALVALAACALAVAFLEIGGARARRRT